MHKIYKELVSDMLKCPEINTNNTNNPTEKWAKKKNKHFQRKYICIIGA